MRFWILVVAALSVPLCVDGNRKDEPVEETDVAFVGGMHFGDGMNRLFDLVPIDYDAWTQATELRNSEYEIDDASHVENDDDDFAVDIRRLVQDCTSYPVVNETGEMHGYNSFLFRSDLNDLISLCYSDTAYPEDCPDEYRVPLNCWNTSLITDMSYAFQRLSRFNDDISSWDTSNVHTMYQMFWEASSFNSDISSWNIGKVTDLSWAFWDASSFNVDISAWDTGKVYTMAGMFQGASSFNVDISAWDTRNVGSMYRMFIDAIEFNQCLGSWAAKTPSKVSTATMLTGTACPNQSDPDPKKGPWCQGFDERCFGACSDAEDFRFGKKNKSCKFIRKITAPTEEKLKEKLRRVCKRKAFPGEGATGEKIRVRDVCQKACGSRGFGPGRKCDKFL